MNLGASSFHGNNTCIFPPFLLCLDFFLCFVCVLRKYSTVVLGLNTRGRSSEEEDAGRAGKAELNETVIF